MEAPSLVLLPPSPSKYTDTTITPASSAFALPDPRSSRIEQDRTSSETTIFTIYSMYGDEQANRASWSASGPELAIDETKTKDTMLGHSTPKVNLTLPDSLQNSFFKPNGYVPSDLSYYGPDNPKPPPTRIIDLTKAAAATTATNGPITTNGSARTPIIAALRPASAYATSSSMPAFPVPFHDRRASTGQAFRTSDMTASSSEPGPSYSTESSSNSHSSSNHPPRNSSLSLQHRSSNSNRDLPPIPTDAPPPSPSPPPQAPLLSPLPSPKTPSSLPLKHPAYTSSPSSKTSLVPSEGEDMDAFHVRNTYAQLESSGVKGDGYEEGVERTRARIGTSRISQRNAEAALGDGNEKTRELDPKEIQTLSSLDRYGFFTVPSHDRLVLIPSAPLLKHLARTPAGPPTAPSHATSLDTLPPAPLPIKETSRIAKWTRMLQPHTRDEGGNIETWRIKPSKESKLRERTYKGIPDRWRGAAWELMMRRFSKTGNAEMQRLGEEYRDGLDKPSSYDIQIDLDVPRTISGHIMFRTRYGAGQRSLFHVLHCFSLRCPTCGYVQGMGPIAATLLCYFDPERVYASLVRLHDAYSMHTIFSPGFPGLLEAIYVQERITEQMMPDVYAAFKKHTISTTSYATKWYITLFANSVPFQTQLRLWDVFLLEGHDVFVAVAVAIVWVYRDHITSSSANFETVLSLLSSFFVPEDENTLLSWIEKTLGDKKLRSSMLKWREDWKGLVASGKDGAALL